MNNFYEIGLELDTTIVLFRYTDQKNTTVKSRLQVYFGYSNFLPL